MYSRLIALATTAVCLFITVSPVVVLGVYHAAKGESWSTDQWVLAFACGFGSVLGYRGAIAFAEFVGRHLRRAEFKREVTKLRQERHEEERKRREKFYDGLPYDHDHRKHCDGV